MTEESSGGAIFIRDVTSEQVNVYNSAVGLVQAEAAELHSVVAGAVITSSGTSAQQAVAGIIGAGNNLNVDMGIASVVGAGNNLSLSRGGATVLMAGNDLTIERGGGAVMLAGSVHARQSAIGILISGETHLEEGSRVGLDTRQAAVFGAALGLTFAVVSRLLRGKCC